MRVDLSFLVTSTDDLYTAATANIGLIIVCWNLIELVLLCFKNFQNCIKNG
jgi:hypothetical protein